MNNTAGKKYCRIGDVKQQLDGKEGTNCRKCIAHYYVIGDQGTRWSKCNVFTGVMEDR